MGPVLEDAARREQLRDGRGRIGADPGGEREPVAAVDRGDRVELHAGEPSDRRLHVVGAGAAEPARITLRRDRDPPDRGRTVVPSPLIVRFSPSDSTVQREWRPSSSSCVGSCLRRPPAYWRWAAARGELTTALAIAGYDIVGIDPMAPHGELFRRLTLDDLEETERYDAVVAARSLHHIRDLDAALEKIATLLERDGLLVVDEFAWDLLDEPTLDWLWGQRRALAAAGGSCPGVPRGAAGGVGGRPSRPARLRRAAARARRALSRGVVRADAAPVPAPRRSLLRGSGAGARRRRRDPRARLPLRRQTALDAAGAEGVPSGVCAGMS